MIALPLMLSVVGACKTVRGKLNEWYNVLMNNGKYMYNVLRNGHWLEVSFKSFEKWFLQQNTTQNINFRVSAIFRNW
jgi:hypothetical protein